MKTTAHGILRGFTLIEILIVITIMAVLVSLLIPAVKAAKERANRIHCANNLAQFGRAWMIYAMDHEDVAPSNLLMLATNKYANDAALFKCRSDRTRKPTELVSDITAPNADTYCSYNLVTKDTDGNRLSASIPPNMMVACDKDGARGKVTATGFGGNHDKAGANILRGDCSVRWIETESWSSNLWNGADLATVVGY